MVLTRIANACTLAFDISCVHLHTVPHNVAMIAH